MRRCVLTGPPVVIGLAGYIRGRRTTGLDLRVDRAVHDVLTPLAPALERVVALASPLHTLLACLAVAAVTAVRRRREPGHLAFVCVAGPVLALAVTGVLQQALARPSAAVPWSVGAFPSGHATGAWSLFAVTVLVTAPAVRTRPNDVLRGLSRLATLVLALALSLALVAGRDHYLTDVVAAAAVSLAAVSLVALLAGRVRPAVSAGSAPGSTLTSDDRWGRRRLDRTRGHL